MIHGASGSVGMALIQLAKYMGLFTIGTAGSEPGLEMLKAAGANLALNHTDSDYVQAMKKSFPNGLDLIIELESGLTINTDLELIKPKLGKIVVC